MTQIQIKQILSCKDSHFGWMHTLALEQDDPAYCQPVDLRIAVCTEVVGILLRTR